MEFSIRPGDSTRNQAEKVIENVLEVAGSVVEKEDSIDIGYIWAPEGRSHGEAWNSKYLYLLFNDESSGWKEELESNTWKAFFQSYFYEYSDTDFHWQVLLKNSFSLFHASTYAEAEPWSEELVEVDSWEKIREEIEEGEVSEELWPEAVSAFYSIIESMNEDGKSLEEQAKLNRSDLLEKGDRIFG